MAVTANLLAAASATPLIGRLADLHNKKHVLLAVLVIVLVGSVLAATTSSLPLLIAARVLQGVSFSLYPICVAILRDELPEEQVVRSLAVLSGTLGFGGGTGLVVTGLLMNGAAGYHRVFWLTIAFTILVIVVVLLFVPSRTRTGEGTIDWLGALGLAVGLTAVLLAITQGNIWGWASVPTIALRRVGCRRAGRLVDVGAKPDASAGVDAHADAAGDVADQPVTVLVGTGLYFGFLGLTQFVQMPRDITGYGFSASVLHASVVFLLPGALTGFVTATASGRFIDRFGARPVLVTGALAGIVGFTLLAVWAFGTVAGDRRGHRDQCLHQPGLRQHSPRWWSARPAPARPAWPPASTPSHGLSAVRWPPRWWPCCSGIPPAAPDCPARARSSRSSSPARSRPRWRRYSSRCPAPG